MDNKANHRLAFTADAKFLERLAKQGIAVGSSPIPAPSPANIKRGEQPPDAPPKESRAKARMRKVREANMESRQDRLIYDNATNSLSVYLPGALLLGLNVMLRVHDASSTSLKATWLTRIEALRLEWPSQYSAWLKNVTYPLVVEEVYISPESRLLDHESVTAACKPILDAFVANGFLPDDNGRVISQPLPFTERGTDSGLLIRFRPSPRPWGYIDDWTIEQARSNMKA